MDWIQILAVVVLIFTTIALVGQSNDEGLSWPAVTGALILYIFLFRVVGLL